MASGFRIGLKADPEAVWKPISNIGGRTGWYFADSLWKVRGVIDRLFGGIGLRRSRSHALDLHKGDMVDFFRVIEANPPYRLKFIAEMRFPGEATLEFAIYPKNNGKTELQQISRYVPRGLSGILYWYALYPFHQFVFRGMLKGIAAASGKPIVWGPDRFTPKPLDVCSSELLKDL